MSGQGIGEALIVGVIVAAGAWGYYLRGVVDDYRMRRTLVRVQREVERKIERRGRLEA